MSYATRENIHSMFRDFCDNTDAAVSPDDLDLFLDNSTCEIDSKIGTLYQMPITVGENPLSFKVLRMLQMYMVACIVDDILNSYGEADKKPMWCKKGMDLMNSLVPVSKSGCKKCDPTMKLVDVVFLGSTKQRSSIKISSTQGSIFKKGGGNW